MVDSIRSASPHLQLPLVSHETTAGESSRQAQVQQTRAITDPREHANVHDYMQGIFATHKKIASPTASPADISAVRVHNEKIHAIATSRANRLLREGEGEAAIRQTMENAFRLDRFATTGTSLVGGLPFTAVVAAQFVKPEMITNPTKAIFGDIQNPVGRATAEGAVGGMEAHFPDEFFQNLFKEAKEDPFFLKAPEAKLHDVIAESVKEKAPGLMGEAMEDARQIQTYLAARVAVNITSFALTATGHPNAAATWSQAAVPLANYLAGLTTSHLKHGAQNARNERGEALMFGLRDGEPKASLDDEEDWFNVYKAAKDGSLLSALGHGGERMGNMLIGAAGNSLDALGKALTSANSIGGGYVGLGMTFAARGAAQTYLAGLPSGDTAKAAVNSSVNALGTGAAFGVWAFVASLSGKLSDSGKAWINDNNHSAPKAAIKEAALSTRTTLNSVNSQLKEGYSAAASGVSTMASDAAAGASRLKTGVSSGVDNVTTGVADGLNRLNQRINRRANDLEAQAGTGATQLQNLGPTTGNNPTQT